MTAEEYLKNKYNVESSSEVALGGSLLTKELIEFAKYHVEKALKQASEDAYMTDESYFSMQEGSFMQIDKTSILESYPLENIK